MFPLRLHSNRKRVRLRPVTATGKSGKNAQPELVSRFGPIEFDWPRSIGYFGGTWLAVSVGLIEPPLGVFIAAIPFLKMLDLPGLPNLPRIVGQILEGVAKPVGGDTAGTVRVVTSKGANQDPVGSDR